MASYLPEVAVLYCIDNSEHRNYTVANQIMSNPKVRYLFNNGNQGLAAALNKGASLALEDGFQWLLTMDQDSRAHKDMLPIMRKALVEETYSPVGILAPFQLDKDNQHQVVKEKVQRVKAVMTSGNLLNLEAFSRVGPFRAEFFIDYLDYEFCLRLKMHGYSILRVNKAILFHNVGDITLNYFLGVRITASNHSPLRRYYITRNRLQVMNIYKKQFPSYVKRDLFNMLKDVVRIMLFEKEKLKKLLYIGYGIRDFRNKRFGKFHE
ncbi:glycosyltransferase [Sabulibacter ruber]|uniref:glycosyltransferase n=1 Tax=Sabulibacter ruber TaxID=2811901 RepID=UPI001A9716A5|nr:glycosyltransferase [Sabulibacter ruber]